jgi:hypothetical protein
MIHKFSVTDPCTGTVAMDGQVVLILYLGGGDMLEITMEQPAAHSASMALQSASQEAGAQIVSSCLAEMGRPRQEPG